MADTWNKKSDWEFEPENEVDWLLLKARATNRRKGRIARTEAEFDQILTEFESHLLTGFSREKSD